MHDYVRSIEADRLVDYIINKDKADFDKVSEALSEYLKEEQDNRLLKTDSFAAQVLRKIVEVGSFDYYTFN